MCESAKQGGHPCQWYESNASPQSMKMISEWIEQDRLEICYPALKDNWLKKFGHRLKDGLKPNTNTENRLPHRDPSQLPLRVLDIYGTASEQHVKLVPGDVARTNDYVALSYTWGGLEPTLLTVDNVDKWLQKIDISELPRTFQDAVWVTRQLNVRYLWIDALCIKQKDRVEWAAESQKMGEIFTFSLVTIAASDASNCEEGFLSLRDPLANTPCYFKSPSQLLFKLESTHCPIFTGRSRLDTRGWVYQERLLAPRTAHFSRRGIGLEYLSGHRCECHWIGGIKDSPAYKKAPFQTDLLETTKGIWIARRCWGQIIAAYSETSLTRRDDKLAAIAGIVSRVQAVRSLNYSFGHWLEWMPEDLLWSVRQPGRRDATRAPSWSWVSVDARVHAASISETHEANCDMHIVHLPDKSPLVPSPLSEGHRDRYKLVVKGRALSGIVETDENVWTINLGSSSQKMRLRFFPDYEMDQMEVTCIMTRYGIREPDLLPFTEFLVLSKQQKASREQSERYNRIGYLAGYDSVASEASSLAMGQAVRDFTII